MERYPSIASGRPLPGAIMSKSVEDEVFPSFPMIGETQEEVEVC